VPKLNLPTNLTVANLNGQIRFIDSENYVLLCTRFDQGICIDSEVYFKNHRRLKNIVLQIKNSAKI